MIEDDFIYCMAGNTHSVGGMKNIVPDGASLTDGKLDCLFVRTPRNLSDIDAINRFVMSHDCDTDMIVSFKTSSLSVTCEKPFRWTLDAKTAVNTPPRIFQWFPARYGSRYPEQNKKTRTA